MTSDFNPTVSLIIPLFNEEEMIPLLISSIEAFRSGREENIEVIFVDDGSIDKTFELVRSQTQGLAGYQLFQLSRNFGHQMAISAGVQSCKSDAAIVMDADLQDPLDVAGRMIDTWKQGYDVVYGVRNSRAKVPVSQRLTAHWYYRLFTRLSDVEAPLDAGDFRLISRNVIEAFNQFTEQQPYVRGLISWLGFKQIGIEYDRPGRVFGKTKYPFAKRFQFAMAGLTSFSSRPLKLAVNLGLLIAFGSLVGLIWVLVTKYVLGTAITGWASLIFAAFFFGGIQLLFLGIVGTYVAIVYDEVKGRPRFVIREMWNSSGKPAVIGSNHGNGVLDESKTTSI